MYLKVRPTEIPSTFVLRVSRTARAGSVWSHEPGLGNSIWASLVTGSSLCIWACCLPECSLVRSWNWSWFSSIGTLMQVVSIQSDVLTAAPRAHPTFFLSSGWMLWLYLFLTVVNGARLILISLGYIPIDGIWVLLLVFKEPFHCFQ